MAYNDQLKSLVANGSSQKVILVAIGTLLGLIVLLLVVPLIFRDLNKLKQVEKEDIVASTLGNNKVIVPIAKGICSLDKGRIQIETKNKNASMYIDLPKSFNQIGGAQYSYSFWLRRGVGTDNQLKNKIIFYRGEPIKTPNHKTGYVYERGPGDDVPPDVNHMYKDFQDKEGKNLSINDRFVKCPLVRFGEKSNSLRIEFNTLRNPHMFVDLDAEIFTMIKSSAKNPKFNLIAFSFQDNFDFGGVERGIKIDIFIDDALVKTATFENNSLKINEGPIVLFATNRDQESPAVIEGDIADLTYYNYALQTKELEDIYNNSFSTSVCQLPYTSSSNKLKTGYSKINLYNETRQI